MQQQDSHELLNYLLNTIADLLAGNNNNTLIHAYNTYGLCFNTCMVIMERWSHWQVVLIVWCLYLFSWTSWRGEKRSHLDPWYIPRCPSQWDAMSMLWDCSESWRSILGSVIRYRTEFIVDSLLKVGHFESLLLLLLIILIVNRLFGNSETLCSEYKYHCECCCSKQEATKRLRVQKLPTVLALHLKRFKFVEQLRRHTKLSHRVVFPWELKLFNTVRVIRINNNDNNLVVIL